MSPVLKMEANRLRTDGVAIFGRAGGGAHARVGGGVEGGGGHIAVYLSSRRDGGALHARSQAVA